MTNYLGLTEDDGSVQESVAVRPKAAPAKRSTPALSVAPQLPIAQTSVSSESAPIDRIVTITHVFTVRLVPSESFTEKAIQSS